MNMLIVGIITGGYFLIDALWYRLMYFPCLGKCINHHPHHPCGYSVWYEYTVNESGEDVTFCRLGLSVLRPTVGKSYKILVKESDHNKVIGYNYYLIGLCIGVFTLLVSIGELIMAIVM